MSLTTAVAQYAGEESGDLYYRLPGANTTLTDDAVTIRDRDTMSQERVPLAEFVTRARQKSICEYDFGEGYDPECFDLDAVNRSLRQVRC